MESISVKTADDDFCRCSTMKKRKRAGREGLISDHFDRGRLQGRELRQDEQDAQDEKQNDAECNGIPPCESCSSCQNPPVFFRPSAMGDGLP
jgi:hypothetical protein